MNKLYSRNAAIKYLKEQTGNMTLNTFNVEVAAGRIPVKPYGNTVRFRQEDLDRWQTLTFAHHSEYTDAANSGTRVSQSSLLDAELSFANLQAKQPPRGRKIGA